MAVLWWVVQMLADRPDRDGSWQPVTTLTDGDGVCQFATYLKYNHGGVMYRGEDVGGSSRSTRHSFDGWWRFVTICQFARDNSHDDVGQRLSCCHDGYQPTEGGSWWTRIIHKAWLSGNQRSSYFFRRRYKWNLKKTAQSLMFGLKIQISRYPTEVETIVRFLP